MNLHGCSLLKSSTSSRSEFLLMLNKKNTDTLIEQTKTRSQETLFFTLSRLKRTFSYIIPLKLKEKNG